MNYHLNKIGFKSSKYDRDASFNSLYRLNNYLCDIGVKPLTQDESDSLLSDGCVVFIDKAYEEQIVINYSEVSI